MLRNQFAVVRRTIGGQFVVDSATWLIAIIFAAVFRYEFAFQNVSWQPLIILWAITTVLQLVIGRMVYLYRGRFRVGTFFEVRALALTVGIVAFVTGLPILLAGTAVGIPRSTVIVALPIALVLMGGTRYLRRLRSERRSKPRDSAQTTLIYGAGYLASHLVPQMLSDPQSPFLPVGLIDDDPAKRNLWVHGVPMMGNRGDLQKVARETGATTLIVCIGRAHASLVQDIKLAADAAGLRMLMLPLLGEILEGRSSFKDLKDVSIEDLIGRHPVNTEVESIASYLQGRKVLVTGAGGSIGSALCREIAKFQPKELMMLDRDESGLQSTQLLVDGHGLLNTSDVILADIRDAETITQIFEERRPEVVFHAAALKHLPMLEQYPGEAWQTNVIGTLHVLSAALKIGVSTFINVSTDKAANPTSVLGRSKRLAEKLTSWAAAQSKGKYLSVRFGNVIGSRGSMLPTFASLIESGGPLTVTHRDVTRYFMTIPEACQLVVQAGGIGRDGEVLILDMGEPVSILSVAQQMIAMSGKSIEIVFTGLRPGEKLHEVLMGENESDSRPFHPKISHTKVPALRPEELDKKFWDEVCLEHSWLSTATTVVS